MKRIQYRWLLLGVASLALCCFGVASAQNYPKAKEFRMERSLAPQAIACLECHQKENPGLFADWSHSRHASANITCLDCHQAEEHDADVSVEHYKQYQRSDSPYGTQEYKVPVAAAVTPKDPRVVRADDAHRSAPPLHAHQPQSVQRRRHHRAISISLPRQAIHRAGLGRPLPQPYG